LKQGVEPLPFPFYIFDEVALITQNTNGCKQKVCLPTLVRRKGEAKGTQTSTYAGAPVLDPIDEWEWETGCSPL
jgi:hypothetical protein